MEQLMFFKKNPHIDIDNPFFFRDYSLCIKCGRCVKVCSEVNGAGMYELLQGPSGREIKHLFSEPEHKDNCTFCGMCINVCPTNALQEQSSANKKIERLVKTTCSYCGVGCQLQLKVTGEQVVGVFFDKSSSNKGHLCAKGQFGWEYIHSEKRLTHPLIRKNGELTEATWDEALDLIQEKFSEALERHGSDAIAGLSSAKITNEENYLFQKFMRSILKTNHIDHCARLCHAASVVGLQASFGSGAMTNTINEILESDVIFVIGANPTEAHPVIGYRIKEAVQKGVKLLVADPRKIELSRYADVFVRQNSGTDIALLNGIAHVIYKEDLWDKEFVDNRTEEFETWVKSIEQYTPEYVADITGIASEDIIAMARVIGQAKKMMILYAMGITQHIHGTGGVLAIANLAMLTGNIGKRGAGVAPLRGQNNVQGACDMGALPNVYPSYRPINEENRKFFESFWETSLPEKPGMTLNEITHAVYNGQIKAMYIVGENPSLSEPNGKHVQEGFDKIDFLVVQDIFLTETAEQADVVLPAASFAEKDGTFTNTERKIQRVRTAVSPPGEAKADWLIFIDLAKRFGQKWSYSTSEDIMKEITQCSPLYREATYDQIEAGLVHWNYPGTETPILHTEKFVRGKGKFHPVEFTKTAAEEPCEDYPLLLTTGRTLHQYHTGTMSRKSKLELLQPEENILVHPNTVSDLSMIDGEIVIVESRRGEIEAKIRCSDKMPQGVVFLTFHYAETPSNILTNDALDPSSKTPELKSCAVKIKKK
ncbi:formate dehydrogenase subunit alpha [Heliorestis acidaminivorans]|uniref:Formate dehydrogenase subunit alpha n=1 Tax=Heliorestis acidaminivorans TaxID=553427 RepID=A0A6I0EX71_9FIRM|nr:formate dehydrogenase subunit alpha [Heliorestis acidaminivorans]KAB2951034.1 formate dehydrogenase subunit alpha [Heliorestis acidaminivorans]